MEFDEALDKVKSYNLKWTFRSIEYLVKEEGVSLNQLRGCVFNIGGEVKYNLEEATKLLIVAGLIGTAGKYDKETYDKSLDRAYEILDDWRENEGFIGILHMLMIQIMEDKHFFMGEAETKLLETVSEKNKTPDVVATLVGQDQLTRINQIQAFQS
jgi:hypothetical protein